MSSLFRKVLAIATVTILTACGSTKGKEAATTSVDTFHQQLDNSKFTEIYSAVTPAFKTSTKEADFTKLLQAVHRKLGTVKKSTQDGFNINMFNGVTRVVLTYKTDFEKGSAIETFTFVTSGDSATLQGYNINSPALITN
jgi:predicted small lipoprotein YifL